MQDGVRFIMQPEDFNGLDLEKLEKVTARSWRGFREILVELRGVPFEGETLWTNDYGADAEKVLDILRKGDMSSEAYINIVGEFKDSQRVRTALETLRIEGRVTKSPGGVFWQYVGERKEDAAPTAHIGA